MERHADDLDASVGLPIRRARPTDAAELAGLCGQLGYPTSVTEVNDRLPFLLGSAEHRVLVAVDSDDRAVGFIHAVIRRQIESVPFVQVAVLVVAEGRRSSGVGLKLLTEAEDWARRSGVRLVFVRSNIDRERAHRFYLRAGYSQAKTSHLFAKQLA